MSGAVEASDQPHDSTSIALHHRSHHGKRLRKLLHPNGRRIHIAPTPDEQLRLARDLPKVEPDENFDIYLHGSPEHLNVVREIHSHHDRRHSTLRSQHTDIYDEFERVKADLDLLSDELHMLTDHGVSLDANFSKFGYDAHIRTRDPDSAASSVSEKRDWDAERQLGVPLTFWRKPIVRQYFHRGLLWRAAQIDEVGSFELFVDLLYVGIIAIIGDTAAEEPTAFGLLRFAITFILGWKMWSDITLVVGWFEIDDIFQRICILFDMICLFGYTLNIVQAFETTWIQLIAFYLTSRLFNASYYLWMSYILPTIRGHMLTNAICVLIPSILWIGSIQVEYPARLALIWPAIVLDLLGSIAIVLVKHYLDRQIGTSSVTPRMSKYFDFIPATNIEHKTERTNAFVTLVFGYSVVALLFQNTAPMGINAFFGKAALGLIQAFAFNWLYFEIDAGNLYTHAIRRSWYTSLLWLSAHLPFIMGYVLGGASLSRLVLATDCQDANTEDLTEAYIGKSEHEVSPGLRWFYCGGLGVALISMSLISLSHVHKEFAGQRIRKQYRLPLRFAVAIILICLPLAEHLSSLELVSTTTGLVVLVLMVDVYGSTDRRDSFWKCSTSCRYAADASVKKKAIVDALKQGEKLDLKSSKTEKGLYE